MIVSRNIFVVGYIFNYVDLVLSILFRITSLKQSKNKTIIDSLK